MERNSPQRRRGRHEAETNDISWGRLILVIVIVVVILLLALYASTNWDQIFGRSGLTTTKNEAMTIVTEKPKTAGRTIITAAESSETDVALTTEATEEPTAMVAKTSSTEKPAEASAEASAIAPAEKSDATSTAAPAEVTEKGTEATAAPAKETEPTAIPAKKAEATVAAPAEESGTAAPAVESKIKGTKEKVAIEKFAYEGGWKKDNDPWFLADEKKKEVPEAFAMAITEETWSPKITTWLKYAVSDPWSLTWFRFQMGLDEFKDMNEANKYAQSVVELSSAKYDKLANETLTHFFEKLDGGSIEISKSWALEVMMRWQDGKKLPELFARRNGDTNHKPDTLITFYDKDGKNFVSSQKAFKVACRAAGASASDYSSKAFINFEEGGTWKWRPGSKPTATPTPEPKITPTPTPEPKVTPTPTPKPTATPTPKPEVTPTPRPTKDPSSRPTPTIGGGPVNPENSADPKTTDHVESTPARPTDTPKPTPKPTAVPTAVVRPTEICEVPAPTPIREDKNTPPPADPGHNVPKDKPDGVADDSFDPDSI